MNEAAGRPRGATVDKAAGWLSEQSNQIKILAGELKTRDGISSNDVRNILPQSAAMQVCSSNSLTFFNFTSEKIWSLQCINTKI